jgi:hypothetical protein
MRKSFKIATPLILGCILTVVIEMWPHARTIFVSKETQFFEACHRSNQAMLFVYGKNFDSSLPCGKCWNASDERIRKRMDARLIAIGNSCSRA